MSVLPSEEDVAFGTEVLPAAIENTEIKDTDGTWTWSGWNADSGTMGTDGLNFTGYWKFTPNDTIAPSIKVSDDSASGTGGNGVHTGNEITYEIGYTNYLNVDDDVVITFELPEGTVYIPTPGDDANINGRTVTWIRPAGSGESGSVKVTVRVDPEAVKSGEKTEIPAKASVSVGGKEPLPTEEIKNPVRFRIGYEFESWDPERTLPEGLPALPGEISGKSHGDAVTAPDKIKTGTELSVPDGVWTFLGWDPGKGNIGYEDFLFTGVWKFTTVPHGDPPVRKLIREGDGSETDLFTFRMTSISNTAGVEVNPMPEGAVKGEKTVTISGAEEFEFGDFCFRKPGIYIYEIAEVPGSLDNYEYDPTVYTLIWYVEEDEDGNLTAEREIEIDGVLTEVSTPFTFEFENVKLPENSAYPMVKKTVSGGTPEADESFSFRLTGISNTADLSANPMPKGAEENHKTIKITGSGKDSFGFIEFPADGDYVYEIEEIPGNSTDYAYDPSVYTVTWHVKNGKVTETILKDGAMPEEERILFNNEYLKGSTSVHPQVINKITGSPNSRETFTFELQPLSNTAGLSENPMPKGSLDGVKKIRIVGEGERGFGSITFQKEGIYVYRILENPGKTAGWTYDGTVYTLTYTVTPKADGEGFDVELSVMKNQTPEETQKFIFTNVYHSGEEDADGGGGDALTGISVLPRTGFAPGVRTKLPETRVDYASYSQLSLEIPGLGINAEILGVPFADNTWDVSWLGDNIGWLENTAWPGYIGAGNVVLTGHSVNYTGYPGIFANLQRLGYGNTIYLNAYGEKLTYVVQDVQTVYADTPQVLSQKTDEALLTLITCRYYNEATGQYDGRVVVTAKLCEISALSESAPKAKSGNVSRMEFAGGLPKMGYSPSGSRILREKPKNIFYKPTRYTIEIPSIGLVSGLLEIPLIDGDYPVEWMEDAVGVLEGSAMPGKGQSVIVAHNHLNTREAGPFALLRLLEPGDRIFVSDRSGSIHIFEVYANEKVGAYETDTVRTIASRDPNSVTFITCEDENAENGYDNRRIVAARMLK